MRLLRITLYLSEFWYLEIAIKSQKLSRRKNKLGVEFVYSIAFVFYAAGSEWMEVYSKTLESKIIQFGSDN